MPSQQIANFTISDLTRVYVPVRAPDEFAEEKSV